MSRKKEVIEAEFLRAETAIDAAQKKCKAATASGADLKDFETKVATWNKLVAESVQKISEWKQPEKDPKRIAWAKLIQSRATKMRPNYAAEISACGVRLAAADALAEIVSFLKTNTKMKLDQADKAFLEAKAALAKDLDKAASDHGRVLNALKNAATSVTKGGAAKELEIAATKQKVRVSDIDTNNAEYKALFQQLQSRYLELEKKANVLGTNLQQLDRERAKKKPTSASNDPVYQGHLKQMKKDYASVLEFATTKLAEMKRLEADIPKLEALAPKTVPGTVKPLVTSVLALHQKFLVRYNETDSHIQKTIRTDQSTFKVQAKAWGITTPDTLANLKPIMDRAFATNFQCKALNGKARDRLQDLLEDLGRRLNSPEAKAGAATLGRA